MHLVLFSSSPSLSGRVTKTLNKMKVWNGSCLPSRGRGAQYCLKCAIWESRHYHFFCRFWPKLAVPTTSKKWSAMHRSFFVLSIHVHLSPD